MLPPDDLDRELAQSLAVDGRTSATSLARTLDVPASTLLTAHYPPTPDFAPVVNPPPPVPRGNS